jgi:hypothetical protein
MVGRNHALIDPAKEEKGMPATQHEPNPARARPVEEIRMGAVRAAIWRNETENGVRHNVTFERIFRDGQEWRSTGSFGRDDLLLLAKVADQAHTWIHSQGREASSASNEGAGSAVATATTEAVSNRSRRVADASTAKGRLPPVPPGA